MTVPVYIGIHFQLSSNSEDKRTDKRYTYDIIINLFKRQAYVLPIQAPWLSYVILGCSISIQICLFYQHDSLLQIYFQTTFVDVLLTVKGIIPIAGCQVMRVLYLLEPSLLFFRVLLHNYLEEIQSVILYIFEYGRLYPPCLTW